MQSVPVDARGPLSPPETVEIYGHIWQIALRKVIWVNGSNAWGGYTHCDTSTIELMDMGLKWNQDNLEHELMHALTCQGGQVHNELWNNLTTAHEGINWGAPRMRWLRHANPQVSRWLDQ